MKSPNANVNKYGGLELFLARCFLRVYCVTYANFRIQLSILGSPYLLGKNIMGLGSLTAEIAALHYIKKKSQTVGKLYITRTTQCGDELRSNTAWTDFAILFKHI